MNTILWTPSEKRKSESLMNVFLGDMLDKYKLQNDTYKSLHEFSINQPYTFWSELFNFFNIQYTGELGNENFKEGFSDYSWFPQVKLNFAQNLLRHYDSEKVALRFVHESGVKESYSYQKLYAQTQNIASYLSETISKGDVVAAYMPNIPQTVVSMLATSALGGVFTSTSCDFGASGVIDRFSQSRPKVLFASTKYMYNGKVISQVENIKKILKSVPSIKKVILVNFLDEERVEDLQGTYYSDIKSGGIVKYEQCNFSDPLYIMYSSGTTGKPKCIVHSVGGTLLQHVKELGLHTNLNENKTIFYFTTCGWMMWNWLVSSLFFGAEIILYEGSPGVPTIQDFFKIIEREKINIFGTSPKFLKALEIDIQTHGKKFSEFETLETIMSTGAPLLAEQFDFVYKHIKSDVQLASICGGTDIIGCFMLGNPLLSVKRGEIQCLGLGMDVGCFDSKGNDLREKEGELVCKKTFPSRPIYFLDDPDQSKINKAYFNRFENIWHHGDYILITKDGGVVVFGRSDATLNPGGVRIGTAEIYRQTEKLDFIEDAICVGKQTDGDVDVMLFLVMREGEALNEERIKLIKKEIRENTTPRHVPKEVVAVQAIPYTRSGKKMEMAVAKLINGKELDNIQAVSNPQSLDDYKN